MKKLRAMIVVVDDVLDASDALNNGGTNDSDSA
jgi:hypothetical protein